MGSVPGIVHRVTKGELDPSPMRKHEEMHLQNPVPYMAFQNLRHLVYDFRAISHVPEMATFYELMPWLSLPSLRRVDAYDVRDHTFRWPDPLEAPESRIEDFRVYATRSHRISLELVVELAKGCKGPCMFTQRDLDDSLHEPGHGIYDWQAVQVDDIGRIRTLGGALST